MDKAMELFRDVSLSGPMTLAFGVLQLIAGPLLTGLLVDVAKVIRGHSLVNGTLRCSEYFRLVDRKPLGND